jgi:hypothetical protein
LFCVLKYLISQDLAFFAKVANFTRQTNASDLASVTHFANITNLADSSIKTSITALALIKLK